MLPSETKPSYAALAIAALLPIVLFASVIAVIIGFREQEALQQRALANVREIANGIDRFIAGQLKAAEVMAQSGGLQSGDLRAFYLLAARLKAKEPEWNSLVLLDTEGHQLINLGRPFGDPLPPVIDTGSYRMVLAQGVPVIGDYTSRGAVTGEAFAPIRVPVFVGGKIKYVLTIGLDPRRLSRLFALSDAPRDWVGAVVDRNGRLLARSVRTGYVGQLATRVALEAIKRGKQGIYEGHTLEGLDTVFAFYTSPLTGWSVHYAVPRAEYQAPLYRILWIVVLSGLLAVALAVVLFLIVARQNALRRRTEIAALQSQKLEALGRFTSGIAHDFNNLLMAIMGNLEVAGGKLADHTAGKNVERAYAAAQRGAELNGQLLAFARQKPLERKIASLNEVIESASELLRGTLGPTVILSFDLQRDLWLASLDPAQIEMALLNLVVNAHDAMPNGGGLRISTRNVRPNSADSPADSKSAELVMLEVRDSGLGMSPEVQSRAMEPFFTTKAAGKGTGLGLSQAARHDFAARRHRHNQEPAGKRHLGAAVPAARPGGGRRAGAVRQAGAAGDGARSGRPRPGHRRRPGRAGLGRRHAARPRLRSGRGGRRRRGHASAGKRCLHRSRAQRPRHAGHDRESVCRTRPPPLARPQDFSHDRLRGIDRGKRRRAGHHPQALHQRGAVAASRRCVTAAKALCSFAVAA